eukprot:FR735937.1.p1 GENE.FR735937.1~~FR735937.1.p1  ORF type:complete len:123 (-),score=14.30 FR735937.1:112-480(-)
MAVPTQPQDADFPTTLSTFIQPTSQVETPSAKGNFSGGQFYFDVMRNRARHLSDWVEEGDHAEFSPPFGAGVIFDAERLHAVAPISEGQRLVLVVEFCESIGLAVVPALYISRTSMPTAYPH